jgi:hypothetical protein
VDPTRSKSARDNSPRAEREEREDAAAPVEVEAEIREEVPSPRAAQPTVPEGFVLQPEGTLLCPENKTLRPAERRRTRVRFRARDTDCRACPRKALCLGEGASGKRGRRVDWPLAALASLPRAPSTPSTGPERILAPPSPVFTPPAPPGPEPVYWYDLPATALRRLLPATLRFQRIEGLSGLSTTATPTRLLNRDRRAHRRLRWSERLARNARPPSAPALRLHVHGVPDALAECLGTNQRR